jgi:hypothetical protein
VAMETDGEKNNIGPLETNIALCFARCLFFPLWMAVLQKEKSIALIFGELYSFGP